MKKILKGIGIFLLVVILSYTLFVIEESYRLLESPYDAKPLIILKEEEGDKTITYQSVGFKLVNKYGRPMIGDEDDIAIVSQSFWLFDKFLIWSWIS